MLLYKCSWCTHWHGQDKMDAIYRRGSLTTEWGRWPYERLSLKTRGLTSVQDQISRTMSTQTLPYLLSAVCVCRWCSGDDIRRVIKRCWVYLRSLTNCIIYAYSISCYPLLVKVPERIDYKLARHKSLKQSADWPMDLKTMTISVFSVELFEWIMIIIIIIIITMSMFMVLSSWQSLREFTRFIWWMQTERRVAANPQTKPTDLGCESAERLADTIRRHHRHLLLLLSS